MGGPRFDPQYNRVPLDLLSLFWGNEDSSQQNGKRQAVLCQMHQVGMAKWVLERIKEKPPASQRGVLHKIDAVDV